MRYVTIRIMAAAIVLAAFAGCQSDDAPQADGSQPTAQSRTAAPGTVSVHLNGRAEVDLGASTR
jgi:hypothetical protein